MSSREEQLEQALEQEREYSRRMEKAIADDRECIWNLRSRGSRLSGALRMLNELARIVMGGHEASDASPDQQ